MKVMANNQLISAEPSPLTLPASMALPNFWPWEDTDDTALVRIDSSVDGSIRFEINKAELKHRLYAQLRVLDYKLNLQDAGDNNFSLASGNYQIYIHSNKSQYNLRQQQSDLKLAQFSENIEEHGIALLCHFIMNEQFPVKSDCWRTLFDIAIGFGSLLLFKKLYAALCAHHDTDYLQPTIIQLWPRAIEFGRDDISAFLYEQSSNANENSLATELSANEYAVFFAALNYGTLDLFLKIVEDLHTLELLSAALCAHQQSVNQFLDALVADTDVNFLSMEDIDETYRHFRPGNALPLNFSMRWIHRKPKIDKASILMYFKSCVIDYASADYIKILVDLYESAKDQQELLVNAAHDSKSNSTASIYSLTM